MDGKHQKVLKETHKQLLDIDPNDNVLDHLYTAEVIQTTDFEMINAQPNTKAKAQALLLLLPKKGKTAFPVFVDALDDGGAGTLVHRELAKTLREAAAASGAPVHDSAASGAASFGGPAAFRSGGHNEVDGPTQPRGQPSTQSSYDPWTDPKYSNYNPWGCTVFSEEFNVWFMLEIDINLIKLVAEKHKVLPGVFLRMNKNTIDQQAFMEKVKNSVYPGGLRTFKSFLNMLGDEVFGEAMIDKRRGLLRTLPDELAENYKTVMASKPVE